MAKEILLPLTFPQKGIDTGGPVALQPPGTTPVGQNVRVYEALSERGRGGSRSGITKYVAQQLPSGSHAVQDMQIVVSTAGEALGGGTGADGGVWPGGWLWTPIPTTGGVPDVVPGSGGFAPGRPRPYVRGASNGSQGNLFLGIHIGGNATVTTS